MASKLTRALKKIGRLEQELAAMRMREARKHRPGRPPSTVVLSENEEIYQEVNEITAVGGLGSYVRVARPGPRLSIRAACDELQRTHRYRRKSDSHVRNKYNAFVRYLAKNG